MRRVLIVLVLVMLAGCGSNEPGTEQLAADLAEVKAERDRLQAQVRALSSEIATLRGNAVVDLADCRGTLNATAARLSNAATDLEAKRYADAQVNLDWAAEGVSVAIAEGCASAA